MKFTGTITALVTPFINQELDEKGLSYNIGYQIANGINGILLLGTTGESSTLLPEERTHVISIGVKEANGKVPVWVGTGSYSTRQTIEKTKHDLGANVALIVTPYYNKPTQEGIYRHFEAIATSVDMSMIIYNIPVRCDTNIEPTTLMKIADLPNIAGVKESSGNINQADDVLHRIAKKHPNFSMFSGDDILTLPMMALGAVGIVSVVSNLVPAQVRRLVSAILKGQFDLARQIHYQLLPLYKMAFIETNPVPIKTAMNLCGMLSGECLLPLYQMAAEDISMLLQLLVDMQLMNLN